jgi:hypothetical protein
MYIIYINNDPNPCILQAGLGASGIRVMYLSPARVEVPLTNNIMFLRNFTAR